VRLLALASLVVGCVDPPPPAPPPRQLTEHELVAVRRLDAHDAAVRHNAEAKQACELWHQVRPNTFGVLYGDAPATPGRAFELKDNSLFQITWDPEGWIATVADGRDPYCDPKDDAPVFCPFRCTDDAEHDCMWLGWKLREAWGESPSDTWLDRGGTVRAALRRGETCELLFQHYVPPHQWIAMTTTAEIPLALLGRSVKRLPARAEPTYSYDSDVERYQWDLAITGESLMHAHLVALVRAGRITGFEIDGTCDEDGGADELHELVRPFLGRVHVELHTRGDHFELAISA
jgi:hypothetical protein